jgi:hypothetical protein
LQQQEVVVVVQHVEVVVGQAGYYRHLLYQLVQEQVIPLLLEQVARRAHMTQAAEQPPVHLALIRH